MIWGLLDLRFARLKQHKNTQQIYENRLITLPETNEYPLKIDPCKRRFLLETHPFLGAKLLVSGRVSIIFKPLCRVMLTPKKPEKKNCIALNQALHNEPTN